MCSAVALQPKLQVPRVWNSSRLAVAALAVYSGHLSFCSYGISHQPLIFAGIKVAVIINKAILCALARFCLPNFRCLVHCRP